MTRTSKKPNQTVRSAYYSISTGQTQPSERRLDNTHGEHSRQYSGVPRYFVGVDQASTFWERIQEIYGDDTEITDAVSQLDEYFSDRSFQDRPDVQKFVARLRRSLENPLMADEIACELIDQGYIEESGVTTSLPRNIVKYAREVCSASSSVSDAIMEQVKADWSMPMLS